MANSVNANRDDALGDLDTIGVKDALKTRSVNSAELLEAAHARLAEVNPRLNAVVTMADIAYYSDEGPFAGIPSFVKDNEDLEGTPTTHGSRATSREIKRQSSPMVELYQQLGFSIIGKSTLPEFGLTATTEPILGGPTRNPRNTDHSTGGSSGGSAALVAAGVIPIAHANDGGGSIRIPAACCGLVGLKPTRGRLPMRPETDKLPVKIATEGVVTRSVRDTALFYAEAEKLYAPLPKIGHVTGPSSRRLRIGVITDALDGIPVDPEVRATVEATGAVLEGLGHHVEPVANQFELRFGMDFLRYWAALSAAIAFGGKQTFGEGFDRKQLEPFALGLMQLFKQSAMATPVTLRRLKQFEAQFANGTPGFDVVLSPVLAHPAPPIGFLSPDVDPRLHITRLLRYACFTPVQNVSGAPAISMPLGVTKSGLPIGVQAAAGRNQDAMLLELAYELEESMGWK